MNRFDWRDYARFISDNEWDVRSAIRRASLRILEAIEDQGLLTNEPVFATDINRFTIQWLTSGISCIIRLKGSGDNSLRISVSHPSGAPHELRTVRDAIATLCGLLTIKRH